MVIPGQGIDNTYAVRMMLEYYGYIKKNGGFYSINESLCELMNENCPELGLNASTKYRLAKVNEAVKGNIGVIIDMLKSVDQYQLISANGAQTEEEDEDDE